MADYRLTNRTFSRVWRRSKNYRDHEIRWLARKRGLAVRDRSGAIEVYDPKTNKTVANFQQVPDAAASRPSERSQALAALKVGLYLLLAFPALAQTYQEKVVAAVLMGEAWGEGERGMTAVAEVIHQRSKDQGKTPLQVVTHRVKRIHAFSCLNGTTPDKLVKKFNREPAYQTALKVARTACLTPEQLPGISRRATHFTRTKERPWWAKNQKPVVVIGNHSFYRMAHY